MLRICISGLSCSGKTTIGEELAKGLGITHITKQSTGTYKKLEEDLGRDSDGSLELVQTADSRYAKDFDAEVTALAEKGDCVISTWLGPWVVKEPRISVWLEADAAARAKRYAARSGSDERDAMERISKKDSESVRLFKDEYGIDVLDHSRFDISINTERIGVNDAVAIISMLSIKKDETKGEMHVT